MQIEKDIPRPPRTTAGGVRKYPFAQMEVGDSFAVPEGKKTSVYQCAKSWSAANSPGVKWSVRKDTAGDYRCWRVE